MVGSRLNRIAVQGTRCLCLEWRGSHNDTGFPANGTAVAPSSIGQMSSAGPSLSVGATEFVPSLPKLALNRNATGFSPSHEQGLLARTQSDSLDASASCFIPSKPNKKPKPVCRFFQQGGCGRGLQCTFSHDISHLTRAPVLVDGTSSCQEYKDISSALQPSKRQEHHVADDGIRCQFGPGAQVLKMKLGPTENDNAEASRRILISGLTSEMKDFDLEARVSTFGRILAIHRTHESYVYCTFERSEDAATAVTSLNGTPQSVWSGLVGAPAGFADPSKRGKPARKQQAESSGFVSVTLVAETGSALSASRITTVKLQWYAPSRVAWLHFNKRNQAEKVARDCQGKLCCSRVVSCKFQRPSFNQTRSFSVWMGGLGEVNKGQISHFVAKHSGGIKAESIQLEKMTFRDENGAQVV